MREWTPGPNKWGLRLLEPPLSGGRPTCQPILAGTDVVVCLNGSRLNADEEMELMKALLSGLEQKP